MSEQKAKNDEYPALFEYISHRDWLAGMAMRGFLEDNTPTHMIPIYCYELADAMIKASND